MGAFEELKIPEKIVGTILRLMTILAAMTGQSVDEILNTIRVGTLDALGGENVAVEQRPESRLTVGWSYPLTAKFLVQQAGNKGRHPVADPREMQKTRRFQSLNRASEMFP